jgi:NLR family CARD domain-containing protein 3
LNALLRRDHNNDNDDDNDDGAVLDALCNGLLLCTSISAVTLDEVNLSINDLQRLLPFFYNTSIQKLNLSGNNIKGHGGGNIIRDLMNGNTTLHELSLKYNALGPQGALGLGQGLASSSNQFLQNLDLSFCSLGNEGLKHLVAAVATTTSSSSSSSSTSCNSSLTNLKLGFNNIEGAEGGRLVMMLLHGFASSLKAISLDGNHLGPLGALALASCLTAEIHLESLDLSYNGIGNDGVANLNPIDGQVVNRTLKILDLGWNKIHGSVGGDNVVALAARCTNLDCIHVNETPLLIPDPRDRLDLILDRNRMVAKAQSLAGSTFTILFRAMEEAHHHKYGLSAIFVILQNDGDDLFCTALNRAMH